MVVIFYSIGKNIVKEILASLRNLVSRSRSYAKMMLDQEIMPVLIPYVYHPRGSFGQIPVLAIGLLADLCCKYLVIQSLLHGNRSPYFFRKLHMKSLLLLMPFLHVPG